MIKILTLNLQLLADAGGASGAIGGEGAASRDAAGDNGAASAVKTAASAPSEKGKAAESGENTAAGAKEESFESLIKGKYKAEYDSAVQEIVRSRLKNTKTRLDRLERLTPVIKKLGERLGVDTSDLGKLDTDAMLEALSTDESAVRERAKELNVSEDVARRMLTTETELREAKARESETAKEKRQRDIALRIGREARAAKEIYPGLDIAAEMRSPAFLRLVANGVPVRTAYEAAHHTELVEKAVNEAARETREKISNSIRSSASRPIENGAFSGAAAVTEADIRSKAYRDSLKERARRGERVVL